MSWESVEEWPDEKNASVYRGAAEIVIARRDGLTPLERARLWWHSTDELPLSAIAQDVVVTPHYVYARTKSGSMQRVRRELLAEGRTEGGRRQYSVPDGVDLVLSDRGGDEVELALAGKSESADWASPTSWFGTAFVLVALLVAATIFGHDYLDQGMELIALGFYNSESAYGVYACFACCVAFVLVFFLYPRRLLVDRLGLRTIRGVLGGVRSTVPFETIERVEVRSLSVHRNGISRTVYRVVVHVSNAKAPVELRRFGSAQRNLAIDFAELCAKTWNADLKSLDRAKSWDELLKGRANKPT